MQPKNNVRFPYYGAFESTRIHGSGTDILATTRHLELWQDDLDLLAGASVRDLRYSAPWHRIEPSPGVFDFSWMDAPMRHLRNRGMNPVIDLLHHTSFPEWLENGFENPAFPRLFCRFATQFARRYEWVDRYTLFNEPLATTLLCADMGVWYPYRRSHASFVAMSLNVARAIKLVHRSLSAVRSFEHVYVETCEHHKALDRRSEPWVRYANARRFQFPDLLLGRLDKTHPLYSWLLRHGASENDLNEFSEPIRIDTFGLDYYPHGEIEWFWHNEKGRADIRRPSTTPLGFAAVAMHYVNRYRLPVMLSETNIRGTVSDRLTWLRFMHEQSQILAAGPADFRGFCWYPSIDSTDWSNLCANCTCAVDPQGIWYLDDDRRERYESELSYWFRGLASGQANLIDVPAYRLLPPLHQELNGFLPLMSHWDRTMEPTPLHSEAA